MLRTLYKIAEAENLVGDTAFEMKPVAWTVSIHKGGIINKNSFIHNVELSEQEYTKTGKKKKRLEIVARSLIPRQFNLETGAARTSGAYAYYLVDKAEYVFGFGPNSEVGKPQTNKKLVEKQSLFLKWLSETYSNTKNKSVGEVLKALEKIKTLGLPCALPEKLKANDLICLKVISDNSYCIHEYEDVKAYWKSLLRTPEEESSYRCLVTGKPFSNTSLFPKVQKVPGGNPAGATLVSFNSNTFESYGWKSAENATISPVASQYIATALNRLIDSKFTDATGKTLAATSEVIAKDTTIAFWNKSLTTEVFTESDGDFLELLHSHWKGHPPHADDSEDFHAFILSGSNARIIIRSYFESMCVDVYKNLKFHWDSLKVIPLTQPPKGSSQITGFYMTSALLLSTTMDGKKDSLAPNVCSQYYTSVLKGESYPLPAQLIHNALNRFKADLHKDDWSASLRRDRQTALLKSYLIRNKKINLQPYMNPSEKKIAYLYGRLLSCYCEMQKLSNIPRVVNVGLAQKYYAKFLANPLATYTALEAHYSHSLNSALKNESQLGKTNATVKRMAIRLNREIEKINSGIMINEISNSGNFTTTDKALFTLGYQQQNHWHSLSSELRNDYLSKLGLDPQDTELLMAPISQTK